MIAFSNKFQLPIINQSPSSLHHYLRYPFPTPSFPFFPTFCSLLLFSNLKLYRKLTVLLFPTFTLGLPFSILEELSKLASCFSLRGLEKEELNTFLLTGPHRLRRWQNWATSLTKEPPLPNKRKEIHREGQPKKKRFSKSMVKKKKKKQPAL